MALILKAIGTKFGHRMIRLLFVAVNATNIKFCKTAIEKGVPTTPTDILNVGFCMGLMEGMRGPNITTYFYGALGKNRTYTYPSIKAVVKYSMNAVIAIYDNDFNVVDILGVATKCIKKCNSYQKHAKRGVKNG